MAKPKATQLVKVIHDCKGNMTAIAASYKVPRSTAYDWVNTWESTRQALIDSRERFVDLAENKLFEKVENGDMNAIFYTLNNAAEARTRGWGVKQENVNNTGEVILKIVNDR